MLMMMMMMKKKGLKCLTVVALLLVSASSIVPPSVDELNQLSQQGEKYLDKQIENAIEGVKEMKSVMQKTQEDHKNFLDVLEKAKKEKEEALQAAQEMEAKLEQEEEVCNDTMRSLWEECKPCLKNTCVKYYSRTCSSGSGLVGRQLEDVLNRTSPFSIWINGEKIDTLEQQNRRQNTELKNLEDRYTVMADGVDNIFSDSMKVADHVHYNPPRFGFNLFNPMIRHKRNIPSLFHNPFSSFQGLFTPMMGMGRNFFDSMDAAMPELDADTPPNDDGSVSEDVVITKPFGDGTMTCREIRRNSAGCIRFKDECQKCKDIQHVDCSGRKPLEGPLKGELEDALASASLFTRQYESLLRNFQQQMFNASSVMDLFNRQFGWVSSLSNNTQGPHDFFRFLRVNCGSGEKEEDKDEERRQEKGRGDTDVSVQLFDLPAMNFSVPGDLPWTDPKFSEVVAQEALDRYKESAVVVK